MADPSVFAGPQLRRIRRREGLTQAAAAARLTISPSYLNLMERNQRPVSARVMMRLVEEFDFDPRSLREDATIGGLDGLARRFADERFADLAIDREEVDEFLSSAPQAAAAFARLYDRAGEDSAPSADPVVASRREIERWRNHFGDLDEAAEELSDEMRLSRGDLSVALTERLRERHQFSVRLLPREVMPGAVRRLDLHARQVQLSEMLPPESRVFQLAVQLAQLEQREAIDTIAQGARFDDEAARELFLHHLTGYFAAALIMPYGRFLRACDATDYDLPVLQRRFGVSFEQLAHRLTTLQRVGQRGLPFFMVRLDRAGQFSKRIVGASGAELIEAEHSCPLWIAHKTFERSGDLLVQTVNSQGEGGKASLWFTIGRTVEGTGTGGAARFAVLLGLDAALAGSLAHARGVALRAEDAVPIGPGCRRCHIEGCEQRSLPPIGRRLRFDPVTRGTTPFDFGDRPPTG
ncbi:MAG: DUF2083 domain-containing protein [Alphaproteobacteria bacterium]|nr:DUF2083 domain-containing protein [Alphaproteobacteria bacterium]